MERFAQRQLNLSVAKPAHLHDAPVIAREFQCSAKAGR
jgi:hypothetical protein